MKNCELIRTTPIIPKGSNLALLAAATLTICGSMALHASPPDRFQQINLVSDVPGVAMLLDTNLVNAWGISFSPASPFWISDNGTGKSTLYAVSNGVVSKVALEVVIPGEGNPTGQVFNNSTGFHG